MENADICRERAERDRALADDPTTTPRMRVIHLESARRWEEMAASHEAFERERLIREEATRERAAKAALDPDKPKPFKKRRRRRAEPAGLPVLVLTRAMRIQTAEAPPLQIA